MSVYMRASFGFIIIIINLCLFSFALVGAATQYDQVQSISTVLDDRVEFSKIILPKKSYLLDKDGHVVSEIYDTENRIYLPYHEIPEMVIQAFLATEDRNFYDHKGFDMAGITRAFLINTNEGKVKQGGSTITQQLVRNIYFDNEKSYNRKLSEVLYAYQLEKEISKEQILEMYINTIYFHNGAYGIEAASQYYFSKPVQELNLAEISFLAAIPNNPSYYDPISNFEHTKNRQSWILTKMHEVGFIGQAEHDLAKEAEITLNLSPKVDTYPNYVSYVYDEFEKLIGENEGFYAEMLDAADLEKVVLERKLKKRVRDLLESGIIIETSLHPSVQDIAENALKQYTTYPNDLEGATVIIDHQHHDIVALVGGKDYKKLDFHRAFQAYRQPGSSIKPLLVYGPYIQQFKASPSSLISAANFCKDGYCPGNYGGGSYGSVSIETALKYSYNTAAVRALDELGITNGFQYLTKFDLEKLVDTDYRLPAAIGGFTYGMTPLEMTNAYTTFGNNGHYQPARAIQRVTDLNGNILYQWNDQPVIVWDEITNSKMRDLLNKVIAEGTGKKAYFTSPYIGGKTGTTNDYKDLWFIGLTDKYTTGVWVGKDRPESLRPIYSQSPHLLMWKEIMKEIN